MPRDVAMPASPSTRRVKDPALRDAIDEVDAAFAALITDCGRLFAEMKSQSRAP